MVDISSKLKGKVVAITGASGYIGSALTLELNKYSVKIVRVSRTKLPPIEGIKDLALDLSIASSWIKIVSEVDIIFHLAGNTSLNYAEKNPKESLKSALLPISQLISASRELCRSPTVVFASTATVYGLTNEFPVVESIKPNPISTYDLHKFFAEQELFKASQKNIINSINLRLANVYGPSLTESIAESRGVLNKLTRMRLEGGKIQIYGDGNNIRDYVYIGDVVNAFIHASIIGNAENILNFLNIKQLVLVDPWKQYIDYKTGSSAMNRDQTSFDDLYLKVKSRFSNNSKVKIIRDKSINAAKMFDDEYFDFIYIDGDHSYEAVLADLLAWYPKLKKFGVMCGDDYGHISGHGVIKAVTEFAFKYKFFVSHGEDNQFWFVKT